MTPNGVVTQKNRVMDPLLSEACKPMGSHFGVGAPPILVYLSGDWDVHRGYMAM